MRGALWIVLFVTGTYAALCLFAFLFQKRLTFFPERELVATPDDVGLPFETLRIPTPDGESLHAWFVPHPTSRAVVLFFHGNAGNMSQRLETLRFWHDLGLSVLVFDYRGYGHSSGRVSEAGTQMDARSVWRYLTETRTYASESVVLFGRSLGAAVAIELAAQVGCAGLVAESAFTSLVDMAQHAYPWLPVRLLVRMRFDSRRRVAAVRAPKLFIHSTEDELVPTTMGRALYEAAPDPKRFLAIRGAHNDGWLRSGDVYRDGVQAFVQALGLP